jgi:hypothetical protein
LFWERCLYGYDRGTACLRQRAEGGRMYLDVDGSYTDSGAAKCQRGGRSPRSRHRAKYIRDSPVGSKSAGLGRLKRGLHREGVCPCILHPASCSLLSKSAGSWFRACVYIRQKSINARSILSIKPRPIHNVSQSRKQICSPDDTISWMYQLQDAP